MKNGLIVALLLFSSMAYSMSARSYLVMEMDGKVILEKNPDELRPIASITKLITAGKNLSLEMSELIEITREDVINGKMKSTPLVIGKVYTRGMLMRLSLVSSDNVAALALGRSSTVVPILENDTVYVEASGLNSGNKSTARSLAKLAISLKDTDIATASVQNTISIDGKTRRSTNPLLLSQGWNFILSKTGFINESGGCLVVITKVMDRFVSIAILGSSNTKQRWVDLSEIRLLLGDSDFERIIYKNIGKKRHGR
jgi:D-alanyl-D-alanine endopeptidase (penicillin-binding protein 7)